jgi:hypothetical protein
MFFLFKELLFINHFLWINAKSQKLARTDISVVGDLRKRATTIISFVQAETPTTAQTESQSFVGILCD